MGQESKIFELHNVFLILFSITPVGRGYYVYLVCFHHTKREKTERLEKVQNALGKAFPVKIHSGASYSLNLAANLKKKGSITLLRRTQSIALSIGSQIFSC